MNDLDVLRQTTRALHLVVVDVAAAHAELHAREVPIGPIEDLGGGVKHAEITDPDGNTLLIQEMAWRTGDAFGHPADFGKSYGPTSASWVGSSSRVVDWTGLAF